MLCYSIFYYLIDMNIHTLNLPVCNSGQYIYAMGLRNVLFVLQDLIHRINSHFQSIAFPVYNSGQHIYALGLHNFFFVLQDLIDKNQFLFSEHSFSEKFASYWLLTLYVTSFF